MKKNTFFFLLMLALTSSFIFHFSNRNSHFQETDSSAVYYILNDFPKMAGVSLVWAYPPAYYGIPKNQITLWLKDKQGRIPDAELTKFIEHLPATVPFHMLYRMGLIKIISELPLPYAFKGTFSLPLSSTYTPGMGLIYGLCTSPHMSYAQFMSRLTALNIILFHLSILVLVSLYRSLHIKSKTVLTLGTLIPLFSISLYSYGYHLGSTIWIFFTTVLWLMIVVKDLGKLRFEQSLSLATAVLVFFNYLILFYWLAILLAVSFSSKKTIKIARLKIFFQFLISQKWALCAFVVCLALFYLPHQSFRGGVSTPVEFIRYTYYIVLNYFSIYNKSLWADLLQFGVFFSLLIVSVINLFSNKNVLKSKLMLILKTLGIVFLAVFMLRIIGYAPTRHLFFMMPYLLILMVNYLDTKIIKNNLMLKGLASIICLLLIISPALLTIRAKDMVDPFKISIQKFNPYNAIVIEHETFQLRDYPKVIINNPFLLQNNGVYLFVSQSPHFDLVTADWKKIISSSPNLNLMKKKEMFILWPTTPTRKNLPIPVLIIYILQNLSSFPVVS